MTKRVVALASGICGLLAIGFVVALLWPKPLVSAEVRKQVDFQIMVPKSAKDISLATDTVKYDSKAQILSYRMSAYGTKITITEQATPEQFSDIPEYFPKLLEKLNNYASFETAAGKVNLTRPQELDGGQAAIVNEKGTLLFAKPDKDLTDSDWRRLFNSFEVLK